MNISTKNININIETNLETIMKDCQHIKIIEMYVHVYLLASCPNVTAEMTLRVFNLEGEKLMIKKTKN